MNRRGFTASLLGSAITLIVSAASAGNSKKVIKDEFLLAAKSLIPDVAPLRDRFEQLVKNDKVEGGKAKRLRNRIQELDDIVNPKKLQLLEKADEETIKQRMNTIVAAGNRVQELLKDEDDWKELLSKQWPPVRRSLNTMANYWGLPNLRERD